MPLPSAAAGPVFGDAPPLGVDGLATCAPRHGEPMVLAMERCFYAHRLERPSRERVRARAMTRWWRAMKAQGVDLHARNLAGETALHQAAFHEHREAVESLLRVGADVHARNARGLTPLGLLAPCAWTPSSRKLRLALLRAGADPLAAAPGQPSAMFSFVDEGWYRGEGQTFLQALANDRWIHAWCAPDAVVGVPPYEQLQARSQAVPPTPGIAWIPGWLARCQAFADAQQLARRTAPAPRAVAASERL